MYILQSSVHKVQSLPPVLSLSTVIGALTRLIAGVEICARPSISYPDDVELDTYTSAGAAVSIQRVWHGFRHRRLFEVAKAQQLASKMHR